MVRGRHGVVKVGMVKQGQARGGWMIRVRSGVSRTGLVGRGSQGVDKVWAQVKLPDGG